MKKCTLVFTLVSALILLPLLVKGAFAQTLLQSSNLTYLGAFRVPNATTGSPSGLSEGGGAYLAFNPANGTLFAPDINDTWSGPNAYVAEITIPALVGGTNLSALNISSFASTNPGGFYDIANGNMYNIGAGGASSGGGQTGGALCGLYVNGSTLIGTSCIQYDATNPPFENLGVFTNSTTLSSHAGNYAGMYGLGISGINQSNADRSLAGYVAAIPSNYNYQTQLGGTVFSGLVTSSINSTTSFGPSMGTWNPANLSSSTILNTNYLSGYWYPSQWTLEGNQTNAPPSTKYWSDLDSIRGAAIPTGSSTVLFFGVHGQGTSTGGGYCYGYGTPNASEQCYGGNQGPWTCPSGYGCSACTSSSSCNGTSLSGLAGSDSCCYDPAYDQGANKMPHAYPYMDSAWFYDIGQANGANSPGNTPAASGCLASGAPWSCCTGAGTWSCSGTPTSPYNNLTAVKLGYETHYQIAPYLVMSLPTHFDTVGGKLAGGTLDPVHNILYVPITSADTLYGYGFPVIEAYQVNTGSVTTTYTVTPGITTGESTYGSISPSTAQTVNSGGATSFTVTPGSGYTASVGGTCGGTLSGTTYTTSAITANCTVTATFTQAAAPPPPGAPFLQN